MTKPLKTYNVTLEFDGKQVIAVEATSAKEAEKKVGEGDYEDEDVNDYSEGYQVTDVNEA